MFKLTSNQIRNINNLKPLTESSFRYNKNRWVNLNQNLQDVIRIFEDKEITRKNIIDSYSEYYNGTSSSVVKPFLLTMVWGLADSGYGWYRTNRYLGSASNLNIIKEALDVLKSNNQQRIQIAFTRLKSITN